MVWGLPPSLPPSLCPVWSRRRPSFSLFPLSAVPVTTLPAVNRRGGGQRGIKRRMESSSNWPHAGHVIFPRLSLTLVVFLTVPSFYFFLPHSPLTFMSFSPSPLPGYSSPSSVCPCVSRLVFSFLLASLCYLSSCRCLSFYLSCSSQILLVTVTPTISTYSTVLFLLFL